MTAERARPLGAMLVLAVLCALLLITTGRTPTPNTPPTSVPTVPAGRGPAAGVNVNGTAVTTTVTVAAELVPEALVAV